VPLLKSSPRPFSKSPTLAVVIARPSTPPPVPETETPRRPGRGEPRSRPRSYRIVYGTLTNLSCLSGYSDDPGHVRPLTLMIVVASLRT
jgi:hypothetical protein